MQVVCYLKNQGNMKFVKNPKRANKLMLYGLIILLCLLFWSAIFNKCRGQMTIPLVKGSVEEGNTFFVKRMDQWSNFGTHDPQNCFGLVDGSVEISTTELDLKFKRRRYEKMNTLSYQVDSIDIRNLAYEDWDEITLWLHQHFEHDQAEKAVLFYSDAYWKLYIYYDDLVFYFMGKVS